MLHAFISRCGSPCPQRSHIIPKLCKQLVSWLPTLSSRFDCFHAFNPLLCTKSPYVANRVARLKLWRVGVAIERFRDGEKRCAHVTLEA